jgi:CheY-like chemotaxis protein
MHAIKIYDREISRILLVDDDPNIRSLYEFNLEDMNIDTEEIEVVSSVAELLSSINKADGFVCDLNLNSRKYSPVNGDVIVSALYQQNSPAVLCSRDVDNVSSVRRLRHSIPCVLDARELNSDNVRKAFEICIKEFSGEYSVFRKPWPTLIRFENIVLQTNDAVRVAIVIPGWDSQSLVEVDITKTDGTIYDDVMRAFAAGEVYRCKAVVNLEVETSRDLYIKDWNLN